ncbi:MAG: 3-deoxy-D-manno-octulosonic acid transferase [Planctomycetes bacterium]|nr:3-deoxy-D-manno-octulosonic acid transferase [Planctomycetota bacterium]
MGLLIDSIYITLSIVLSPLIAYLFVTKKKFRQGIWDRFGFCSFSECKRNTVWIHGSSVGEIMLLKPLISHLERESPQTPIVITAFTSTGNAAARKYFPMHMVLYFPIDLSFIVKRYLRALKPGIIIIVESEFWPNFIYSAHKQKIPVVLLNGKISGKSLFIYRKTLFFRRVLPTMSVLAVQNEKFARRFRLLGVPQEKIVTTGNMKYDLLDMPDNKKKTFFREKFAYPDGVVLLIGGSTHPGEDEALMYAFGRLRKEGHNLELILVPRYPENVNKIETIVKGFKYVPVRKTMLSKLEVVRTDDFSRRILIVDTIGELNTMYRMADIAYVGGSMFYRGSNKGGHNMMEPAILGVATMFGPYNSAFQDTVDDLLKSEAAIMVRDKEELYGELKELLRSPEEISRLGKAARDVIVKNRGATRRNLELLRPYL